MDIHICKAKRTDNGQWIYGYFLGKDSYGETCFAEVVCQHGWNLYQVDPETVCRCTGKKDKNGNLIFEYDVLLGHKYDTPMTVVWDSESAQFIVEYEMGSYGLCTNTVHGVDSLEIVCNINDI